MIKALVTGGGGFLGQYIVEQLLQRGDEVTVFCRGQYAALDQLGVRTIRGDIQDAAMVSHACSGMDAVFHVAAVPGIWGPWKHFHGVNTVGTRNVVSGCELQGVSRLIFTSSPSVVFDGSDHVNADESLPYPTRWMCHYPHSKALAEQHVLAASCDRLRTISLRPHLIWGPRDNHLIPRLIDRARSGRLRRVGDGTNVVSISYVENAAAAHLQAEFALRTSGAAAGKPYFVNDPEGVNLWEWINRLLLLADLPEVSKSISHQAASRIGHLMELAWKTLPFRGEPPMTRFVAAQLAGSHCYSTRAAEGAFGYVPVVQMSDAMQRLKQTFDTRLS